MWHVSWDSSISIVTRLQGERLRNWGSVSVNGMRVSFQSISTGLGAQPACCAGGYWQLRLRVKDARM
jgi:hypothetical protein